MNTDNEKYRPWQHGLEDVALCAGLCLGLWFVGLVILIGLHVWIGG